ncbi:MAG: tRNA uridine-5-carboxymethylaminomethyl(34) synthesis GTPase MnmE [Kiloniellales bacterium]
MAQNDTIFALSTAAGRAGVAVVRISGPRARSALAVLGGPTDPKPRHATLVRLQAPGGGAPIDQGLALWFPQPHSFTGEDQVELQLHGGRAVVAAALEALGAIPGLRPAEPGEFTHRAFDNGKLDLSEVEGLADLVAAETEAQRRQALRQMSGALSDLTESWRGRLVQTLAHLEADIDFPDEDLPAGLSDAARGNILGLIKELAQYLDDRGSGERLRDGFHIAIVGPPNVGKSSLLNAIARRDAAIVSETAGTTRDVIEVHLDLGGYPVTLVDTAGLRAAAQSESNTDGAMAPPADGSIAGGHVDPVEAEGMRRARDRAARADLKLVVCDAVDWPVLPPESQALIDEAAYLVVNKVDLAAAPAETRFRDRPVFPVSALEGRGLTQLLDDIEGEVVASLGVSGAAPSLTRARHRRALEDCRDALGRALKASLPELAAEDVRLAVRALGRITGRVDVEDVLDAIFREFCIGK